eukprot:1765200-Alexandrium_andersonii.AAC.1
MKLDPEPPLLRPVIDGCTATVPLRVRPWRPRPPARCPLAPLAAARLPQWPGGWASAVHGREGRSHCQLLLLPRARP